jgi:hypothetical protein
MKYFWTRIVILGLTLSLLALSVQAQKPDPTKFKYRLKCVASGKCLDVYGGSKVDGANVQQWSCHDGDNQRWIFKPQGYDGNDPVYLIINVGSGKCLDVEGASLKDGANIIQYSCHSGKNQLWKVKPIGGEGERKLSLLGYQIISVKSGKCLDVSGSSLKDGANVLQWTPHNGDNQRWLLDDPIPIKEIK